MGYKECPYCGAYLDPDETCDCDGYMQEARRIAGEIIGRDAIEAAENMKNHN